MRSPIKFRRQQLLRQNLRVLKLSSPPHFDLYLDLDHV
jgi:hypothetical protein